MNRKVSILIAGLLFAMLQVTPAHAAPPTATFSIVDNATNVAINANIVITFSETVTAGTTGSNSVNLAPPAPGEMVTIPANNAQVTISTNTVTINPSSDLTACAQYSLTVESAAFKNAGNEFYAGTSVAIRFTTLASGGGACPPTVLVQSPEHNQTGVARNANIGLQFASSVTASFVASGTISIFKNLLDQNSFADDNPAVETIILTGNPTTEDPRVSASGSAVIINPNLDFDALSQYYVVISNAAIKNQANTNFAGYAAGAYKFTTGSTAVAPTVYQITSAKNDGFYKAGEAAFDVKVKFSQIVDIVGSPILNLNVTSGGFPVTCTTPGNDIAVATGMNCSYTIVAGHNSVNSLTLTLPANQFRLNVASSAALTLPTGVTIAADASGPNATLTLPVRGSFSLGDGKEIKVDTTAPTLQGGLPFPGATGVARATNLTLKFSEDLLLVNTKTVTFKRFDDLDNRAARTATISNAGASGEVFESNGAVEINPARDLDGPTIAVTNKALTSNVATLTTASAHSLSVGATIVVSGVDNTFNGRFTVVGVPSLTTLTYANTAGDVVSAAVSPAGGIGTYSAVTNKALASNVATLTTAAAHGLAVGDLVVVGRIDDTFNGTFAVTAVTATTLTYAKTAGDVASAAVSPTGHVAQQIPTQYYISIPADAITDRAGNAYAGLLENNYSFTTGVDTIKPTLIDSDPLAGMTTFSPLNNAGSGPRPMTLRFSEGVSAVASKNITITPTGGSAVTYEVATSSLVVVSSSTVTITPSTALASNATFTLTIEAGAFVDSSTNANLVITFTFQTNVPAGPAPIGGPISGPAGPVLCGPPPAPPCIFGPAPSFGAGGVPLGNSLTGGNMGSVDPNAFRNFNPNQAGAISADAMAGFNRNQFAALPPSAMGGFNQNQMAALPPEAMGGFNSNQMRQLSPSAMGGFNSSQLAALPPNAMQGFNSNQFAALPPSAMGGFNQNQMAALPPNAMQGFNQNQMAALPPEAMGGFNAKQMTQLPPSAMGGFNQAQFAALPPSAMTNFKPDQMAALPPSAMQGFNSDQMRQMPPNAMQGFNSNQMRQMPPSAMGGFNSNQMKVLSPAAMGGLQEGQFAALPPQAMIGFKPEQFSALAPSAISGMQQNQFKAIPPNAMGAFTPTQMDAMPVGALAVISPSQFKSLTAEVIASMSPEQRSALPQQAFNPAANLAPANTGNATALAGALTGWNVDKVPANAFANFKPADASKLSPEVFSSMNPSQFKAMPATAFAGFKPDQVSALTPQVFAGMKSTQFASMPATAFGSFNTEQLGAMLPAAFTAMKPTQVGALPAAAMATMSPQQVGALPATAMSGLKAEQVSALPPAAMATMKPGQVGALTPAAVGSLSADQVGALPATAFTAMRPTQVGALPAAAMASMSPQQVGALPVTAMSGLKAEQVSALPDAAIATLKPTQVAELKPAAAAGFSNEKLAAMTPAQEKALTPEFVKKLTPEQKAALSG